MWKCDFSIVLAILNDKNRWEYAKTGIFVIVTIYKMEIKVV